MENLKKDVSAIYEAEQKLAAKTKKLILGIVDCLNDVELDGVKRIPGTVNCGTVSFKTVFENHKTTLSPDYYLSNKQIQVLRERITSLDTLSSVSAFLNAAINDGHVIVKGEKIVFNPAVKSKLIEIQSMF